MVPCPGSSTIDWVEKQKNTIARAFFFVLFVSQWIWNIKNENQVQKGGPAYKYKIYLVAQGLWEDSSQLLG